MIVEDSENPELDLNDVSMNQDEADKYQTIEEAIKENVIAYATDNTEIKDTTINYFLVESTDVHDLYETYISVTDVFENQSEEKKAEFKVNKPTSIGREPFSNLEKMVAYPNPVKDNLFVKYGEICGNEKMHLEIYSTDGREVMELVDANSSYLSGEGEANFDVSKLNQGLYVIQATCKGKTYTTKILKE